MIAIRPYEPRDRAAVREICCDTADGGEPSERFFPDREVLADLVTRYYTDFAPQTSWVAEQDGQVMGYLTGCLDTRRSLRTTLWRIVPAAFLKAIGRGLFWHPQFRKRGRELAGLVARRRAPASAARRLPGTFAYQSAQR